MNELISWILFFQTLIVVFRISLLANILYLIFYLFNEGRKNIKGLLLTFIIVDILTIVFSVVVMFLFPLIFWGIS